MENLWLGVEYEQQYVRAVISLTTLQLVHNYNKALSEAQGVGVANGKYNNIGN